MDPLTPAQIEAAKKQAENLYKKWADSTSPESRRAWLADTAIPKKLKSMIEAAYHSSAAVLLRIEEVVALQVMMIFREVYSLDQSADEARAIRTKWAKAIRGADFMYGNGLNGAAQVHAHAIFTTDVTMSAVYCMAISNLLRAEGNLLNQVVAKEAGHLIIGKNHIDTVRKFTSTVAKDKPLLARVAARFRYMATQPLAALLESLKAEDRAVTVFHPPKEMSPDALPSPDAPRTETNERRLRDLKRETFVSIPSAAVVAKIMASFENTTTYGNYRLADELLTMLTRASFINPHIRHTLLRIVRVGVADGAITWTYLPRTGAEIRSTESVGAMINTLKPAPRLAK